MSYLVPRVRLQPDDIQNNSKVVSTTATLLLPALIGRVGFIIQNNTADDLWFGFSNTIAVKAAGTLCLPGGKNRSFIPEANGVFAGDIWALLASGSGRIIAKQWAMPE